MVMPKDGYPISATIDLFNWEPGRLLCLNDFVTQGEFRFTGDIRININNIVTVSYNKDASFNTFEKVTCVKPCFFGLLKFESCEWITHKTKCPHYVITDVVGNVHRTLTLSPEIAKAFQTVSKK